MTSNKPTKSRQKLDPVLCPAQLNNTIRAARAAASNELREICGLLIDAKTFWHILPLRNKSKGSCEFSFYASEVRAAVKASTTLGFEVVGTFHSHPAWTADPGDGDIAGAVDDSYMLIIDTSKRNARLWHVKNGKAKQVKFNLNNERDRGHPPIDCIPSPR